MKPKHRNKISDPEKTGQDVIEIIYPRGGSLDVKYPGKTKLCARLLNDNPLGGIFMSTEKKRLVVKKRTSDLSNSYRFYYKIFLPLKLMY